MLNFYLFQFAKFELINLDTVNVYTPATEQDVIAEERYARKLCSDSRQVVEDINDALSEINYNEKTILSAESRNAELAQHGYTNPPPYKPQSPVIRYQQTSSVQYVRVYTLGNNKIGCWLMKSSDIQGLTAAEIKSKFALKDLPTHYCFVNVPAGTTLYVGLVNQSSVSRTLQYELAEYLNSTAFGADIPLP